LASGDLSIVVLDGDLIAEEPRRLGAGVGDQRLGLGQLQLEILLQELGEALLDLLGFLLRSNKPEQVGSDRGALPIFRVGAFPRPALRTRRAALTAPGSPQARVDGFAFDHDPLCHGEGIAAPR